MCWSSRTINGSNADRARIALGTFATCDRVEDLPATSWPWPVSSMRWSWISAADGDGLEWLRHHRTGNLPLTIILTARRHDRGQVLGLDAGADDYLSKPFELANWPPGCGPCCVVRAGATMS
ncbi:MAG: hypothetical protein R3D03_04470 [Geminicoccaceae bacterium]